MSRIAILSLVLWGWTVAGQTVFAQFKTEEGKGCRLGDPVVMRWQAGMVITASGGACRGIKGTAPIPRNWPEQQVEIVEEDISPGVSVRYQTVDGLVDMMVVQIPNLPGGKEAKAVVTVEVRRFVQLPPPDTSIFRIPESRQIPSDVRPFLGTSPKIESRDPKITAQAKEIFPAEGKDWDRVKAIYDWVREHVTYKQNTPLRGALAALKDGTGDCEDMTSLFVALCRALGIPSRTVWVQGHCYPEFFLVDDEGKGYWFPCQVAGTEAFGEMPDVRIILQKGDNFRSPINSRERVRYLAETLTGGSAGADPSVRFIRQRVAE